MLGILRTKIREHPIDHLLMQLTAACAEGTALLSKVHRDRTAVPLIALTRDRPFSSSDFKVWDTALGVACPHLAMSPGRTFLPSPSRRETAIIAYISAGVMPLGAGGS